MRAEHLITDPLEIRQDYKDLLEVMQLDDSSSEGSSSSDEDLDFLILVSIHISSEICFYFTLFIVV